LALEAEIKQDIATKKWSDLCKRSPIPCCEYNTFKENRSFAWSEVESTSRIYLHYLECLSKLVLFEDTIRISVNCKVYDIEHCKIGLSTGIVIREVYGDIENDTDKM
jgi:hypothetical protein